MKRFVVMALAFSMAAVPAVARALPLTPQYRVVTDASTSVTTSSLSAAATYNYAGIIGAKDYPGAAGYPTYGYALSGTADTTGLAISSWDRATASFTDNIYGMGTASAAAYAASDLATGTVHVSARARNSAVGLGLAQMFDTLHFTVAGATSTTITPIQVRWRLDGTWSYVQASWYGDVFGGVELGGTVRADMIGSTGVGGPDFTYYPGHTGQWDWASYSYGSDTTGLIEFTGTYDLVGNAVTLPFYMGLEATAGSDLGGDTALNFTNTSRIELELPGNVSLVSDSGVFLSAAPAQSPVAEPACLVFVMAGLIGVALAGRARTRAWRTPWSRPPVDARIV